MKTSQIEQLLRDANIACYTKCEIMRRNKFDQYRRELVKASTLKRRKAMNNTSIERYADLANKAYVEGNGLVRTICTGLIRGVKKLKAEQLITERDTEHFLNKCPNGCAGGEHLASCEFSSGYRASH